MTSKTKLPIIGRACGAVLLVLIGTEAASGAQPVAPAQPAFKLGTFELSGRVFVGLVLRDLVVVDFAVAHQAIKVPASSVAPPTDMKDLITRYNSGVRERILQIVGQVNSGQSAQRQPYVYQLKDLRVRPPIMYPSKLLNTAVNYRAHAAETQGVRDRGVPLDNEPGAAPPGTKSATAIWERQPDDKRWNPYMFLKSPSAIIAEGETILLPPGRKQVDWECELEANSSLMIHDVFEQVVYASNILTLQIGDVVATGTPGGVGNARKPPVFFKDGDLSVCTYEGIGTLTNPVKAL